MMGSQEHKLLYRDNFNPEGSGGVCVIGHNKLFRLALRTLLTNTDFAVRYESDDISGVTDLLQKNGAMAASIDMVLYDLTLNRGDLVEQGRP